MALYCTKSSKFSEFLLMGPPVIRAKNTIWLILLEPIQTEEIIANFYILLILFLIVYLAEISGLLSRTSSSSGLGFILVSVSTSVLINGHKYFDFRRLLSPKFPCHPYGWRLAISGVRLLWHPERLKLTHSHD